MIQHEDIVDRKLIALAGKFSTATTRLIQNKITPEYFKDIYRLLVQEMFDYYSKFFKLLSPDPLAEILVEQNKDISTITAIVATFDDILNDPDLVNESSISELDFFIDRIQRRHALEVCENGCKNLSNAIVMSRVDTAKDIMMKTITLVDKISNKGEVIEGSLKELADPRIKRYQDRRDFPERFRGIQSGFPILDRATDGYQPGELVLYVSESGGGKSVNLLHSAFKAWLERYIGAGRGANVALFTIEMDWDQYLRRFDAMHASLDSYKMKSASLNEKEYAAWLGCIEEQKQKDNLFYIVDMPAGCTVLYIRNKLDEIRMKYPNHPIDLVVVDYIGIMEPSQDVKEGDWYRQGIISQELKQLARQEKLVVLSAVQETRESIKDTKNKNKNTTVAGRSQMIVANTNIMLYLKPHQIEETDDDYEIFKTYNDSPNIIHYTLVKSRDSKKVQFRCGADFSRMLIQPMDVDDEEEIKLTVIPKKEPDLKSSEDEEEFDKYYEKTRPNAVNV